MNYSSSIFLKSKIFALFFAIVAISAYAGEGNINFNGQLGVHKTQSAQTLGHGRFGLGLFLEGAGLTNNLIEDRKICASNRECYEIDDYKGLNGYPFLSLGLSDYFDFSIGIPLYGEYLKIKKNDNGINDLSAGAWGDLFISSKLRVPFEENFPLDVAALVGFGIGTSKSDDGNEHAYGPWVRDPMFLKIEGTPVSAGNGPQSTHSNANPFIKFGLATTFDFGRLKTETSIPVLLHLNGTYRMTLGKESGDYSNIPSFSTALEWTPIVFLSVFGEYYKDWALEGPAKSVNLSTATFGVSFHLGETVDLQLGVQKFVGDGKVDSLSINVNDKPGFYNAKLIPNFVWFGGLAVKLSTVDSRNPDTDGDGVCDPWVAETGKQSDYSRKCQGIDLCPYEAGPLENKGCPVKESKFEAPTIMFTAMPDVVQKGQSVTLTWQVSNASKVNIEGVGEVSTSGSKKLKPESNTTYTLTAVGEGGTQTVSTEVEVTSGPLPVILFTAAPATVQVGQEVTLNWQVTNATEVDIEGLGRVPFKGTRQVKPAENTVFKLVASGEGGKVVETASVTVTAAPVIEARVNLQGVTFGSGNATLTANAKKILDGVAEQLVANPNVKIEIQGHTDSQGKPATNKDLSERRARAVVAYLSTKGVKPSRMKAVGYGQDMPIADNGTAEGRELNRRIEMIRIDE